jgi:hypothetical protein
MSVTATSAPARHDGKFVGDAVAEEPVSELIEQAGRAAGVLALREAQLAVVRHGPQLRRAAVDVAVALGSALAFLTAFALANWAAVSALSGPLPGWAAPLLLAAAWIVIGIALLVVLLNRADGVFNWQQRRLLAADVEQRISARERARDEAWRGMRESLERLTGGVEHEAAVLAVVPAARGVVNAGEHIVDQIDEITDDLEEAIPGGGVINWVADTALLPARYFVSVARAALEGLAGELIPPVSCATTGPAGGTSRAPIGGRQDEALSLPARRRVRDPQGRETSSSG